MIYQKTSPLFASRFAKVFRSFDLWKCSSFSFASPLVFLLGLTAVNSLGAQTLAGSTLPTAGQVVAGNANIAQTGNTLNVVQSSSRAVINWGSYNVGKDAAVVYQQPDANSVTLNRVTSVTPSQIDGAVKANGTVIFSNPNGVTFGKTAQVDAGAIVATTMNQSNEEFMAGKNTYTAAGGVNAQGKILNQGKLKANDYVALMAPEVRNEGVIVAYGGTGNNAVALASGSSVTLNFNGNQFVSVSVNASVYRSLIENKRLIEAAGGTVIIAANSAAQLMASVIKNSGRVSTTSMVASGGKIEIIAGEVTNSGSLVANARGASGDGGRVSIAGDTITLTNTSKIAANSKIAGNGGVIHIMSNKLTSIAGRLLAMGGSQSGNGGQIETSSHQQLIIDSSTTVSTNAPKGKAGTWLLDPYDLTIDSISAAIISAALQTSNVTVQVVGNVCSGGTCTQNGSGNLTLASGVAITKSGAAPTVLTFLADGTFYNYGSISQAAGSVLEVSIQAQNVNFAQGSSIDVNKVTVQAVNQVIGWGTITGSGVNPLVNILAAVFNFNGAIAVSSSTQQGGQIRISANQLILASTARLEADGYTEGGVIVLSTPNNTGMISIEGRVQTNGSNGRGGTITVSDTQSILVQNATLQADGTDGGQITLTSYTGDINIQNSLIQTNGSTGRGGSIGISGANSTTLVASTVNAQGWSQGGTILIGNDAKNGTLPFSLFANLDAQTNITGATLAWYSTSSGGTALSSSTAITNGTYYVAQISGSTESVRIGVTVVIETIGSVSGASSVCSGTSTTLTASGFTGAGGSGGAARRCSRAACSSRRRTRAGVCVCRSSALRPASARVRSHSRPCRLRSAHLRRSNPVRLAP